MENIISKVKRKITTWKIIFTTYIMSKGLIYIKDSWKVKKVKVAQLCPTLCDPHGLYSSWNSPGQNPFWPFPSPGDCPNPGIIPWSPALQANSLPTKPQGKPKNTVVGSLFLLQQIFPTQESAPGSPAFLVDSLPTELSGKPWKLKKKDRILSWLKKQNNEQ